MKNSQGEVATLDSQNAASIHQVWLLKLTPQFDPTALADPSDSLIRCGSLSAASRSRPNRGIL